MKLLSFLRETLRRWFGWLGGRTEMADERHLNAEESADSVHDSAVPDAPTATPTSKARPADLADDVTKWTERLTAVLAVVTSIGGGAVTLSGGAERMFREQPVLAVAAAMLVFWGFAFLALGAVVGRTRGERSRHIAWSIMSFVAALTLGTVAVVNTSDSADQPGLTGVITMTDDQPKLELTLTASGLSSDERVNVLVSGVTDEGRDSLPLFTTVVGANRDGVLSATFSVSLTGHSYPRITAAAWAVHPPPIFCDYLSTAPPEVLKNLPAFRLFCSALIEPDCNDVAQGVRVQAACLYMRIPGSAQKPSLALTLARSDDAVTLAGTVSAVPVRGNVVYLSIYPSGSNLPLYATKLVPKLDGSIAADLDIGLDPALTQICVVALEAAPEPIAPSCPGFHDLPADQAASTTWLTMTVPPEQPEETEGPSPMPEPTPTPELTPAPEATS